MFGDLESSLTAGSRPGHAARDLPVLRSYIAQFVKLHVLNDVSTRSSFGRCS